MNTCKMNTGNELLRNLDKLYTAELGAERVIRNEIYKMGFEVI